MEKWNIGILEYWNDELKKDDIPPLNSRQEEFYNNPTFHFLSEPEASVPIFQHSPRGVGPTGQRPIVSKAN